MSKAPRTLQEAIVHYSNPENCHEFMVNLRWSDGKVRCPNCGSENVSYLPNARVFKCYEKHDRQKFSLKVGTIFEDSPLGLDKWLVVMWMLVNCKNGVSSYEIHRAIGVTQKSAWFMLQRCRLALQDEGHGGKIGGEVEVDETFIGGKARNMHKNVKARRITGRGGKDKAIVLGMLERGKTIRTAVFEDRGKRQIQPHVKANVEIGSAIFSDEWTSCWRMDEEYQHNVINHAEAYVNGNIHT